MCWRIIPVGSRGNSGGGSGEVIECLRQAEEEVGERDLVTQSNPPQPQSKTQHARKTTHLRSFPLFPFRRRRRRYYFELVLVLVLVLMFVRRVDRGKFRIGAGL